MTAPPVKSDKLTNMPR